MKTAKLNSFWLPILGLLLLGLGACRIDLNHEIWLNNDNSGRARIETSITIPNMDDEESMKASLGTENGLDSLATIVRETVGAELIKIDQESSFNDEEMNILYYLEFSFDNIQTLQKILCIEPDKGISIEKTGKTKTLRIDPRQFAMQESGDYQEYFGMISMNMSLKINLPEKAKEVNPAYPNFKKQKKLSWAFPLDEDWYNEEEHVISVKY
ncbi:MAG: hypothetical protein PHY48_08250 [Candidatus Cloacimonetes bacterium]|nr:hypothetical protein [Candidatus Cloacimonadota bacterium]